MNDHINAMLAVIGLGYVGLPLAVEFGKRRPTMAKADGAIGEAHEIDAVGDEDDGPPAAGTPQRLFQGIGAAGV